MWLQCLLKQMPNSRPPPQAHTPADDITGFILPQKSINMQKQVSANPNPLLESIGLISQRVQTTRLRLNLNLPAGRSPHPPPPQLRLPRTAASPGLQKQPEQKQRELSPLSVVFSLEVSHFFCRCCFSVM